MFLFNKPAYDKKPHFQGHGAPGLMSLTKDNGVNFLVKTTLKLQLHISNPISHLATHRNSTLIPTNVTLTPQKWSKAINNQGTVLYVDFYCIPYPVALALMLPFASVVQLSLCDIGQPLFSAFSMPASIGEKAIPV